MLQTPSCTLRRWSPSDASSLAVHANNPRIARRMRDGFPYPYRLEDADRFITMACEGTRGVMLVIDCQGEAVGGIGIIPLSDVYRRTAEIGYWLSESFWGKGIVTDAVRAVIPLTFGNTDILRLQAGVFGNNPASMRVLEKCGFAREAVHRDAIMKNGEILDEHLYVLFRDKAGF